MDLFFLLFMFHVCLYYAVYNLFLAVLLKSNSISMIPELNTVRSGYFTTSCIAIKDQLKGH